MKTKKGLRAAIITMAAITGANAQEECAAARQAFADMAKDGHTALIIDINNPWGGFCA